jgi:N-acetylmuramoyl-L-alanine amidase
LSQHARDHFFPGVPSAAFVALASALVLASSLLTTGPGRAAPADDAAAAAAKPAAAKCDRSKFRIILDVGHTKESYGAMSARYVPEFEFNLNLGRKIEERLKADGFAETYLMVTEGKARPSLMRRVAVANKRGADLFLSIHHDSVPGIYNESWEFEGKKRPFNDLFAGYSVFVSQQNAQYRESLRFAKLVGNAMASQDLQFARQYDQWFMGKYQRELLDHDAGVYRYDQLIVLKMTRMPAVLLESGSIINRDEEVVMASQAHKDKVSTAVTTAAAEYCDTRTAAPPQVSQPQAQPKTSQPKPRTLQAQPKPQAATRAAARKR